MRHLTTPPPPPLLLRVPALLPLNIYPPVLLPPPGPEAEYPFTGLLLLLLGPCVLRPVAEAVPAPDAGGDSEPEGGCGAPAVALRPSRCSSRDALCAACRTASRMASGPDTKAARAAGLEKPYSLQPYLPAKPAAGGGKCGVR